MRKTDQSSKRRRGVVAAVLVGTALSALGPVAGVHANAPVITAQAVTDISRYCTACWRNARLHPDQWADCTQEVFARLMDRVQPESWNRLLQVEGDDRRELLRAIDAVKKRTQRARKPLGLVEAVPDRRDLLQRQRLDESEVVRQAAAELLSRRQQQILQMASEGWSVNDIAKELDTPAARVSDEKYKAIRKLREHLAAGDAPAN